MSEVISSEAWTSKLAFSSSSVHCFKTGHHPQTFASYSQAKLQLNKSSEGKRPQYNFNISKSKSIEHFEYKFAQEISLKKNKRRRLKKSRWAKSKSLLDEIKSHDIYTVDVPDQYPLLPNLSQIQDQDSSLGTPLFLPHKCGKMEWDKHSDFRHTKKFKSCYASLPILVEEVDSPSDKESIYKCVKAFLESSDSDICLTSPSECSDGCSEPNLDMPCNCTPSFTDYECQYSEESLPESESDSEIEVLDDDWESWVDLSKHTSTPTPPSGQQLSSGAQPMSPDRITPLAFGSGEEYLRLLKEAQKESNQSSARVSLASSRRDTPKGSPKSPPNSPNIEMAIGCADPALLRDVYLNYFNKEGDVVGVGLEKTPETDWIWDWSSRTDEIPQKEWRFLHQRKGGSHRGASMRRVMVGNSSLFSRDVMYTLLITNVLSILLGTGIGIWLSKRSSGTVTIEALPLK